MRAIYEHKVRQAVVEDSVRVFIDRKDLGRQVFIPVSGTVSLSPGWAGFHPLPRMRVVLRWKQTGRGYRWKTFKSTYTDAAGRYQFRVPSSLFARGDDYEMEVRSSGTKKFASSCKRIFIHISSKSRIRPFADRDER